MVVRRGEPVPKAEDYVITRGCCKGGVLRYRLAFFVGRIRTCRFLILLHTRFLFLPVSLPHLLAIPSFSF
jgi:hypothetical protein